MPVGISALQQHVARWVEILKKSSSPYRRHWPPRLFRHEPVENASLILRSGQLLSRNAAQGLAPRDIADKQIIASQIQAHTYARLYFRPKSPTQYHIEGIRKPGEYYRNDPDTHAPVLVILVFKAEGVLNQPGACFSDGNMQSPRTTVFYDDPGFNGLPFDQIYHVVPVDQGSDTVRCRCAEALVPKSLTLDGCLQAVLCRSPAERATLLHMLGDQSERWAPIIRVYTEPGIFENRYAYIDSVALSQTGVIFTTHPRYDVQPISVNIRICTANGNLLRFSAASAPANRSISCGIELAAGLYLVEIELDGCLAYRSVSLIDELPF